MTEVVDIGQGLQNSRTLVKDDNSRTLVKDDRTRGHWLRMPELTDIDQGFQRLEERHAVKT